MPGGGRKNRINNKYQQHSNSGVQKSHSYQSNSGSGGSYPNRFTKHNGNNNRKIYFNPSIISSLEEDDYNNDRNSNSNNNNNNKEHRKSNKDRRMVDRLKDMGLAKSGHPKLSIGDDDNEIKKVLLESKPHCQISNLPADVFAVIVTYVQNYFTCFDTKRDDLLGAYNPKCTFSLVLNMGNNQGTYRQYKFDDYSIRESRNLKRLVGKEEHHHDKRFRLQHRGYIDTLSVLTKLPPTEHDPRSFKLDISFFSPNMITFSLCGVFKEGKQSDRVRPLRSFHRLFVCIPDPNSQMTIVNEQFTISNITNEQFKTYYDTAPQAIVVETTQATTTTTTTTTTPTTTNNVISEQPVLPGLNEQQTQMIKQFSINSRLNLEWSKHCLEHVGWNFDEAAKAFVQFKDSIPQDAFLA